MLINIKLNKDLNAELNKTDTTDKNFFKGSSLVSFNDCDVWGLKGNFIKECGFNNFYSKNSEKFILKNIWLVNKYDNVVTNMKCVSSHQVFDDCMETMFAKDHNSPTIQNEINIVCKYHQTDGNYRIAILDTRKSLGFESLDNWYVRFEFELTDEPELTTPNKDERDEPKCGIEIRGEVTVDG